MSTKNNLRFRLEWQERAWFIVDPDNEEDNVQIDQAVVDTTYIGRGAVEGFILAVHGLDQDVASNLSRATLNELGVGANLRSMPPPRAGLRRVRLEQGGRIANI